MIYCAGILASNLILLSLKVKQNSKQDLKILEVWRSLLAKPTLSYARMLLTQTQFNLYWSKQLLRSGVELLIPLDEEIHTTLNLLTMETNIVQNDRSPSSASGS